MTGLLRIVPLAIVTGCAVTPITGKIDVGEEAFVVAVGEGEDGATDLFAAPAKAGRFYRLTFTRVPEDGPRLSPSGTTLAFFRRFDDRAEVVVLDLTSMAEKRARVDSSAHRIGWSAAGDTIFVAIRGTTLHGQVGPALLFVPMGEADRAAAEIALAEPLGDPAFATVARCRRAEGICAVVDDSTETVLGDPSVEPVRWGPDAVGYVKDGRIEVRPLGGGRPSHPNLTGAPRGIRQLSHHPGKRSVDPNPPNDARSR